jgi:histidinol-phosphatase
VRRVSADLDLALSLADDADAISLPRFRAVDLRVDTKPDLTPVTDADRAVERALRERLSRERPDDGVLGEEEGETAHAGTRWVIDPIDGTKNFTRGIPLWATLIALERDGAITCGVVSAPAFGHRWWAAAGEGAYRDGERLRVSGIEKVAQSVLSFSARSFRDVRALELFRRAWHAQPFSDFWSFMLLAEGSVDVAIEHEMNPWDNAPLKVIVEEAGGRFTNLRGDPRFDGGSAVATNGLLHDEVVAQLNR